MLVADRVIVGDGKRVIEQGAVVLDGKRIRAEVRQMSCAGVSRKKKSGLRAVP